MLARVALSTFHGAGYHDPVTARFVEATAPVREKLRLPVSCFERAELPRRGAQSGVMTRSSK